MPFELTDQNVLPEGLHDVTLDQVRAVFGGFQRSDRRIRVALRKSMKMR